MITQEVTLHAEFRATLMAGGMSRESADKLVSYLEDEKHDDAELLLFNDARLEMAEALSPAWIIRELKGIAKGNDKQAAVAALNVLQQMSMNFYPEFILRTAK
ncbi:MULTISPECIES: hypothetical protein [unclassified Escherichia]|uniref:hypothetical protein n=1 Tax=unclassified Escherichia TaxID=2608889 RepID=UPI000CF79F9C|nr:MULTISPECIES: hypothetical protein [unclassified Escherichia]